MKTLRHPAAAVNFAPVSFLFVFWNWSRRAAGLLVVSVLLAPVGVGAQAVDTAGVRREVDSLIQASRGLIGQWKFDEALWIIEVAENRVKETFGTESAILANCLNIKGAVFYNQGQ